MTNKIYILLSVLTIIFLSASGIQGQGAGDAEIQENPNFIHEPIFNSNIYICETGKDFKNSVLLVHGIGEDASDIWKNVIPVLEKQFHVINFDLPGFGRSDKDNALYSPKNYALLIKWIYDKYVNGPMYLIGHSMGGAISLYYAGAYPENVQRLILVDAAGILHGAALSRSLTKIELKGLSKLGLFKEQIEVLKDYIESTIETNYHRLPKDISIVLETPFLRKLFFNAPKKIASAALINTDFSRQIENVKAPLFIIWGKDDPVAPLRTGKMLSLIISGSRLNVMPGLGHNPMLEKPSEFNNLIAECLSNEIKIRENQSLSVNKKNVVLNGKENLFLEGVYGSIEINDCRNSQIRNVKAGSIKINNSSVEIENAVIKSDKTGMSASDSNIIFTGGSLSADVGLLLFNSNVDLAGVKIEGRKAAVSSAQNSISTVIFSICKIKSPYNDRFFHEVIEIKEDNPF